MQRYFRIAVLLVGLSSILRAASTEPLGAWYLSSNGFPITLTVTGAAPPYAATLINENGGSEPVDNITWDDPTHRLEFRRIGPGFWQWYRGKIVEGILVGRFSHSTTSAAKPSGTAYAFHVTGWNSTTLDAALTPRVWEVLANGDYRARLRIDAAPDTASGFIGRFKVYSTISGAAAGEEQEYDVEVTQWDGTTLRFTRRNPSFTQLYTGTVSGRTISGMYTHNGAGAYPWNGTRAEVLTYGYGVNKGPIGRAAWQDRTRKQLDHLMMAGNPAPASVTMTTIASNVSPFPSATLPSERDDDPAHWPQNYKLTELRLTYTFPVDFHGNTPASRNVHAYLAVPTTSAPLPGGKYPALLAVNGHGGSAYQMMTPDSVYFWYGDAFARRGYVVLAVDISHRPVGDRSSLYGDVPSGDDSAHGNGSHPAIKAAGYDSDWEEDGERAWDAMRGLDYLLSRSDVDGSRVVVTGLSMGGEVTTIVGGLDPRLAMSIPAGFSADLGVMLNHGNHPCWRWQHADVRDYIDTADFYALTAPRPLIIETGKADGTFSQFAQPFAADKQIARRARVAYGGETANVLHYLHYDEHHYHAGDVNPTHATESDVRIPEVIVPTAAWFLDWQGDARTFAERCTLFQCARFFLRLP